MLAGTNAGRKVLPFWILRHPFSTLKVSIPFLLCLNCLNFLPNRGANVFTWSHFNAWPIYLLCPSNVLVVHCTSSVTMFAFNHLLYLLFSTQLILTYSSNGIVHFTLISIETKFCLVIFTVVPKLAKLNPLYSQSVGSVFILNCNVYQGNLPLLFKWQKDNVAIDSSRIEIESKNYFSQLALNAINVEDAGNYTCTVSDSSYQMDSQWSILEVKGLSVSLYFFGLEMFAIWIKCGAYEL